LNKIFTLLLDYPLKSFGFAVNNIFFFIFQKWGKQIDCRSFCLVLEMVYPASCGHLRDGGRGVGALLGFAFAGGQ